MQNTSYIYIYIKSVRIDVCIIRTSLFSSLMDILHVVKVYCGGHVAGCTIEKQPLLCDAVMHSACIYITENSPRKSMRRYNSPLLAYTCQSECAGLFLFFTWVWSWNEASALFFSLDASTASRLATITAFCSSPYSCASSAFSFRAFLKLACAVRKRSVSDVKKKKINKQNKTKQNRTTVIRTERLEVWSRIDHLVFCGRKWQFYTVSIVTTCVWWTRHIIEDES